MPGDWGEGCAMGSGFIKRVGIAIVALVVVASLVGCGGKKSSKAKEAEGAQTEQTAQQQAQPAAEEKKEPASQEPAQAQPETPEPAPQEQPAANAVDETLIRPEFKEAMDSYEAFFDEYIDFMNRYKENPTNAELLMQYADMLNRESTMLKEFDDWEKQGDMTTAETAYYLEVHARIYQKLATVA